MRSRQSAAYKGLYALRMRDGAKDFRTGDTIQLATYFNDEVDIHHIFPQGWFKDLGLTNPLMDSVVNKTPLSKRTNIQIGKKAPSKYLAAIEQRHKIAATDLDGILETHVIDPAILRSDDFERFYEALRFPSQSGHPTIRLNRSDERMSPWQSPEGNSP